MTLFLYILREYVKYVVGTIVLTLFLFILFDFIHKSTKYFPEYEAQPVHIFQYYLYQIPSQVVQGMPIAALLASVVCMILLSRTNEITAMRAAGMGPAKIAAPLAIGGLVLSSLCLLISEVVVPNFARKMHYVQEVLIEQEDVEELATGVRWIRSGETFVNYKDYDPVEKRLIDLRLMEVRPNFRPRKLTQATEAVYQAGSNQWLLRDIKILDFNRNGTLKSRSFQTNQSVALAIEPKKMMKERRKPNELSFVELTDYVERGETSGVDILAYRVEAHAKLAYPFAAFVVSLIGLKFGYKSERTTETAKGILLAFGIGILYWFIFSAGRALGRRGDLEPFFAAWLANVVIFGLTMLDAWRARKA